MAECSANALELPAVPNGIVIGPDEYIRGKIMCFAKNRETGLYFRLGRREAVILRGLQEGLPADALSARYEQVFGRPLSETSLKGALELFTGAGLVGATAGEKAGLIQDQNIIGSAPMLFSFKIYSWDPDLYLDRIIPFWGWLGRPWNFALVATLAILSEALVLSHFGAIFKIAYSLKWGDAPARLLVLIAVNSVMFMLHEGAHALVCKSYGGQVREMGFLIRYLTFTPYTRVDDVLLFPNRWKRAAVLAAGPLTSLLAIPIAYAVWSTSLPGTLAHQSSADVLIWYNLISVIQFIPFLQLDGYFILAQFLHMPNLRQDSFSYIYRRLMAAIGLREGIRLSPEVAGYVGPVYFAYGLASFVLTGAILALIISQHAQRLTVWLGPLAGYAIITTIVGLLFGRFLWRIHHFNGNTNWS